MKKSVFLLSAILIVYCAFSQEEKSPRLVFNSLSFGVGPYSTNMTSSTIETFRKLAPKSELLNIDFEDFNNSYYYDNFQTNTLVGAYAHFAVDSKAKSVPLFTHSLRVGLVYGDQSTYYNSYDKFEAFTIDTLVSVSTGDKFPLDSTANTTLWMSYEQSQLFVDIAYLLQTRERNRLSLYGGAGVMVGINIDASTHIYLDDNYNYSSNTPYPIYPFNPDITSREEVISNKSGFAGMVSIPVGVDFRIGDRQMFWKNSHLAAEIRPSISINQIPEIGTDATTGLIGMFTYRYQFR